MGAGSGRVMARQGGEDGKSGMSLRHGAVPFRREREQASDESTNPSRFLQIRCKVAVFRKERGTSSFARN